MSKLFTVLFALVTTATAATAHATQNLARDSARVPEILQDQYLVATSTEHPAIQTWGVTTCIAVTLYDPALKLGAMMHVSASTDIPVAVATVVDRLVSRGSHPFNLQAQLLGGWGDSMSGDSSIHFESRRMANQLYFELAQKGTVIVRNETVTEKSDTNRAPILDLEFNLQTGAVYRYQPSVFYSAPSPALPLPTLPLHNF